jgi:hypothetical protein
VAQHNREYANSCQSGTNWTARHHSQQPLWLSVCVEGCERASSSGWVNCLLEPHFTSLRARGRVNRRVVGTLSLVQDEWRSVAHSSRGRVAVLRGRPSLTFFLFVSNLPVPKLQAVPAAAVRSIGGRAAARAPLATVFRTGVRCYPSDGLEQ